jgi:4-amino-4-deoxy-L-arabinose transferase-like glycosyltransferase
MMRIAHVGEGGSYIDGVFDNPPLFIYLLALLSKILGSSILIFRFFIVFCTLLITYLIYQIGCIIDKKRAGLVSSSLFAFFPMTVIFCKIIQIDLFAIMLMTATFYFAVLGIKKDRKWFYLTGLFLGLTVFTKFPAAMIILPIFYFMFYKKVEIKYFLLIILITILIQIPWIYYFWNENPSFLLSGASSSRNFFGLGVMHTEAPFYQLSMILLAVLVFILLIIFFWRHKPKIIEQKILVIFTLIFSGFFVLLPNHEYYLLPVFVPFFLYLGFIYGDVKKEKKVKKIITIFLIISISFLIIRPIYDVNWEQAVNFVKENYSDNVTIYSTAPTVTEYYFNQEVNWLHPKVITNISDKEILIIFTCYDRVNLEDLNILSIIEEKFILLKSIDEKIFIYGSKDLA